MRPELATLVIRDGWGSLLESRSRLIFERDVLPVFFGNRRWFAEKGSRWLEAKVGATITLTTGDPSFAWSLIDVSGERGKSQYSLPLGVHWTRLDGDGAPAAANVLAPVRSGAREGTMVDAAEDRGFITWLTARLNAGDTIEQDGCRLEFRPSSVLGGLAETVEEVRPLTAEQSNTSVVVNGVMAVKLFRRVRAGINPDVEISRFLTDVAGYQNTPSLLGTVELEKEGERFALAIVQRFVENQGDGWHLTSAYLDRFLEEHRLLAPDAVANPAQHAGFLLRVRQIGRRLAELHLALSPRDGDAAFAPEPVTPHDLETWRATLIDSIRSTIDDLFRRRGQLPEELRETIETLVVNREAAVAQVRDLLPANVDTIKIRHHGDLHLGQLLIVKDDVFIIDFEGEPERSIEARRQKAPAARDLAGLVRSLDYAGTAALDRMGPLSPEERLRLSGALDDWSKQSVDAFLSSYRETLGGSPVWPSDSDVAKRMLDFFTLEKAIYEIGYEMENRPAWLHVPLQGMQRLLLASGTGAPA